MSSRASVLVGLYFYPRGGSAHAARAVARQFAKNDLDVRVLAGSRTDLGRHADAAQFFHGIDALDLVDFTPALQGADAVRFPGGRGTAPMHGSYEERDGAQDPILAGMDDATFELHVEAWGESLLAAGARDADVLYLNHLTPLNEAATRYAPDVPVVGHIHGSELLMLERIAEPGCPWQHAEEWAERMRAWAAVCHRLVVNSPQGLDRASEVLAVPRERFVLIPNGYESAFAPNAVDRAPHWRRHLVEDPQGWAPGEREGSVTYEGSDLQSLAGTVLVYSGRFTDVKRVPLMIEAFEQASDSFEGDAALVLVGGFPGEWEGEHPIDVIARTGARNVYLAGWQDHEDLPSFLNASDVLVLASVREQFGQVVVEAMACGLPVIAVDRHGPAWIVDDGQTGWLVPPDDRRALADAMTHAVNDPAERRRRGSLAREEAAAKYSWDRVGEVTSATLREVISAEARNGLVPAT